MPFSVGVVFTIEVEHQSEDVGSHHPTLDHLVHTRLVSCFSFSFFFFLKKRIPPTKYLTLLILSNYKSYLGDQGVIAQEGNFYL